MQTRQPRILLATLEILKKFIRNNLFLYPLLKTYRTLGLSKFVGDLQTRWLLFNEIQIIKNLPADKPIWLIYDNLVSPPTYGDYIYVLMVARFFLAKGHPVKFSIIIGEYRHDWKSLIKDDDPDSFIKEQHKLADFFLSGKVEIEFSNWNEISLKIENNNPYIFFERLVKERISIYNHCFNLLNQLLSISSDSLRNQTLLNKDLTQSSLNNKFGNYISIVARYNPIWSPERNLQLEELITIVNCLKKHFIDNQILIISDEIGCAYFKEKLATSHFKNLSFSKDWTKDFIDDFQLAAHSRFYFQLRGGGLFLAAVLSNKTPYLIIAQAIHEKWFNQNKFSSWQTSSQIFLPGLSLEDHPDWCNVVKQIARQIN